MRRAVRQEEDLHESFVTADALLKIRNVDASIKEQNV